MEKYNKNLISGRVVFGLVLSLLFLSTASYAGGPWPKKKGKGYYKISEWWMIYDQHYSDTGLKDPNTTTGIFNTLVYAEYGLSDRLTGIFNGAVFSRNYMNNVVSLTTGDILSQGEAINSVGDLEVGVTFGITKESSTPISVTFLLGIPAGKTGGGSIGNLQTGDGEFNQIIKFDVGKSFSLIADNPAYISASVGFNNRTREYSEEFRYGVELGFSWLNSKLWTTARFSGIESFKNGATAATANSASIFANNTELINLGLEANYYIKDQIGISIGMSTAMRGEIIAAAPAYNVGLFFDFSR